MTTQQKLTGAYEKLTAKKATDSRCATHNHDSRGEPVSAKLARVAKQIDTHGKVGEGTLRRTITGGVSVGQILKAAANAQGHVLTRREAEGE